MDSAVHIIGAGHLHGDSVLGSWRSTFAENHFFCVMIFVLAKHYVNAVSVFDDLDPITTLQMSVQRINRDSLSVPT
jgi:hypothetical protein